MQFGRRAVYSNGVRSALLRSKRSLSLWGQEDAHEAISQLLDGTPPRACSRLGLMEETNVQKRQPAQSAQPAQPTQPESAETESEEGTLPEEMTFSLSYRHGSIFRSYIPCFVVVNRFSVLKYPNDKRNDRKVKEIALIDAVVDVSDARAADP